MFAVLDFKAFPNSRIWIKFNDQSEKVVDLKPHLGKAFTKELLSPNKFNEAYIESGGGIAYPNGFDICPEYLKEMPAVVQTATSK